MGTVKGSHPAQPVQFLGKEVKARPGSGGEGVGSSEGRLASPAQGLQLLSGDKALGPSGRDDALSTKPR